MRIPTGNFGNVTPTPQQGVRAPQGLGSEGYNALARTGQQLQDTAMGVLADQRREEERLAAKAEREAEEVKRAAIRAQTITTLTSTKDGIDDDADQVVQGVLDRTIPKDQAPAELQKRIAARMQGVGKDLPEAEQQIVLAELNSHALQRGNVVRKAVVQRDREDVTTAINQTLEYLQRRYVADPTKADAQAEQTVQELVPYSTMTPDAGTKLLQSWKEKTQFTAASSALTAARRDVKTLDAFMGQISNPNVLPHLDPQQRAQLTATAEGYKTDLIQRAEAEAQRRAREAEARLNKARAEMEAAQYRMDSGQIDAPEQVVATTATLAGTPYLAVYKAGQSQARENGGFATMPLAQQRAALDQAEAQIATHGATEATLKRLDSLRKIVNATEADVKKDALRAGVARRWIDAIPVIDTSSPEGFMKSIGARVDVMNKVSRSTGQPESPLRADEVPAVVSMLSKLPAGHQRGAVIAGITAEIGASGVVGLTRQIAEHDRPLYLEFAVGDGKTTAGRYRSELVRKGIQAIQDKTVKVENTEQGWRSGVAQAIGDIYPNDKARRDAIDAAFYIRAAMEAEGDTGGSANYRAARLAVGGEIIDHNGQKIPLPAGMDESGFRQRLRGITPATLQQQAPDGKVRAAGVELPLSEFVGVLPHARLVYAGSGRYSVQAGGSYVTNSRGERIVIGVGNAR